jgi:hypothetical protein
LKIRINDDTIEMIERFSPNDQAYARAVIGREIPHKVTTIAGDKVILCDIENARIEYTVDEDDLSVWSEEAVLAYSYLLASMIAIPIAGVTVGASLRDDARGMYNSLLAIASANNKNQTAEVNVESDFTLAMRC